MLWNNSPPLIIVIDSHCLTHHPLDHSQFDNERKSPGRDKIPVSFPIRLSEEPRETGIYIRSTSIDFFSPQSRRTFLYCPTYCMRLPLHSAHVPEGCFIKHFSDHTSTAKSRRTDTLAHCE